MILEWLALAAAALGMVAPLCYAAIVSVRVARLVVRTARAARVWPAPARQDAVTAEPPATPVRPPAGV